ncbi:hypothetical protein MYSTI_05632 [Myxococcus stipitatus DSM 14675]|uniref:Lipoprotein n=1 Tax=Myxococcus stipitatus (strain DSM 14675 / JCM 12634 / Mx s8) TaxID=1278073 RepID=L7UKC3_MYXSD|nr:hypothetical protein [Myxococcus stipitatus]AGC46909.1 hypothetical protein MYSTI_05632 [Myxococcus stipitatus DSM 14675]
MKKLMMLSMAAVLGFAGEAAASSTGLRKITNMGCAVSDNTCWVEVAGAAAGPAGCSGNSLRWSMASTGGKNILSLLTGAFLAGKEVRFEVVDTACYAESPAYPTFHYINFN